jgi:hypothetical protein
MVAACDLRWAQGLVTAVALFHPPNPGRAGTRPFQAMASIYILLPSLLVLFPLAGGWWS